jgi:hypothetical protein
MNMQTKKRNTMVLLWFFFVLPGLAIAQKSSLRDTSEYEYYYAGINIIAPFTSVRSDFASRTLPAFSNLETGLSAFIGKVWAQNYNVETRVSFGSPRSGYNLFQVHSGFLYCFVSPRRRLVPYAGLFVGMYSLHNLDTHLDYVSAMTQLAAGSRVEIDKWFIDFRLSQHLYALSWSSQKGERAKPGFQPGIYDLHSPYVPRGSINIGFYFR